MKNYRKLLEEKGWDVKKNIFTTNNRNRVTYSITKNGNGSCAKTLKELFNSISDIEEYFEIKNRIKNKENQ